MLSFKKVLDPKTKNMIRLDHVTQKLYDNVNLLQYEWSEPAALASLERIIELCESLRRNITVLPAQLEFDFGKEHYDNG